MVNPSISERKHYRLVGNYYPDFLQQELSNLNAQLPGEPIENTSTIVLTSKDSHFVDVRILLEPYKLEKGMASNTEACLQWAFAGKSRMTAEKKNEKGDTIFWHNVWDHWIDSKSNKPEIDEGEMTVQKDGTVLEEGVNVNAATGAVEHYEELWDDLPVEAIGKKQNRSSIVVKADHPNENMKGLVIKVGGWCQGIAKHGDELTVQRWRRQPQNESGHGDESTMTRNDWVRVFNLGTGVLPCMEICSNTTGKLGYNSVMKDKCDVEWRVIEEYYY